VDSFKHNKSLTFYARSNRKGQTDAERLIWYRIRAKNLQGYKFRRQFPVLNYIIDFYCEEVKVAIEVDGSQHVVNKVYDQKRDAQLNKMGIYILRFWDNEVLQNIDAVLEEILKACYERRPHPALSYKERE
jgi:very-short-patch-repair endonuclease